MNILLEPHFKTLHGTAPFSQIKLEDYETAIVEGMRQEDEAIEAIIRNPEPPTFENTIAPSTGELLERTTSLFFNLVSANTSDEMDELAQKLSPMLTEHYARIMHNEKLFERNFTTPRSPSRDRHRIRTNLSLLESIKALVAAV